jgi:hypothetical protein
MNNFFSFIGNFFFSELEEIAPSLEFDREAEEKDKYFDREYALRKIGIRSNS